MAQHERKRGVIDHAERGAWWTVSNGYINNGYIKDGTRVQKRCKVVAVSRQSKPGNVQYESTTLSALAALGAHSPAVYY
jgi:hypothetical protein